LRFVDQHCPDMLSEQWQSLEVPNVTRRSPLSPVVLLIMLLAWERTQACMHHVCIILGNSPRWSLVADFPLDYLPLASPEATAHPLFSDAVLGSRMAGSRAASGSPAVCSRAA
jgi:hypothetical protein